MDADCSSKAKAALSDGYSISSRSLCHAALQEFGHKGLEVYLMFGGDTWDENGAQKSDRRAAPFKITSNKLISLILCTPHHAKDSLLRTWTGFSSVQKPCQSPFIPVNGHAYKYSRKFNPMNGPGTGKYNIFRTRSLCCPFPPLAYPSSTTPQASSPHLQ